jgi:hypothetical protein
MSDTERKLEETKYFLNQMKAASSNAKSFTYNLNAFLSSARSVTLVMQAEFKKIPQFHQWYQTKQAEMARDEDFRMFNELRVESVHRRPVASKLKLSNEIKVPEKIYGETFVEVLKVRIEKDGSIIQEIGTHSWSFDQKPDADAVKVCEEYLGKINAIVSECHTLFKLPPKPHA